MLIASKYEEIYAPEVRDFVYITDNAYTKEEILQMEQSMLSKLDFNITVPSAYRFLERFSRIANASSKQWNFARYLIELPLIEQRMLKYCPSLIAASAMYLSRKITQGNDAVWT
jgi:cyclin B